MWWVLDLNYGVKHLPFEANGQRFWVMYQDLKIVFPSYATKDVFVVVKSLGKNQCKGNALKQFHYFTFPFC
jgi:hypothetical protein